MVTASTHWGLKRRAGSQGSAPVMARVKAGEASGERKDEVRGQFAERKASDALKSTTTWGEVASW